MPVNSRLKMTSAWVKLQPELSAQALNDNVVLIPDGRVRAFAKRRVSCVVLVSGEHGWGVGCS